VKWKNRRIVITKLRGARDGRGMAEYIADATNNISARKPVGKMDLLRTEGAQLGETK
jgi:hypothetical protein